MGSDWFSKLSVSERAEFRQWLEYQEGVVLPAMKDSGVVVSIAPTGRADAKFCVELGMMIMLGKPVILLVEPGMHVPDKLRLVADEVIEARIGEPGTAERMQAAMERLRP